MIKLIITSTAAAPKEFLEENNISVVRLTTDLDGVVRKEGFSNEWDEYYEALSKSSNFPKTSLPNPQEFLDEFNKVKKGTKIIVLTISKSLSGTFNAANIARDMYCEPDNVFVIDSDQCTYSELLIAEEVAELIKTEKDVNVVLNKIEELKTKTKIQFVPSTMEYLRRGGRIGLISGTIASVLNIKPILEFKNGKLTNTKKCLGMGKAIDEIIAGIKNVKKLYVCYIHESKFVQTLIERVNKAFGLNILEGKKIGPVVGSHIGIGAVGIASLEI